MIIDFHRISIENHYIPLSFVKVYRLQGRLQGRLSWEMSDLACLSSPTPDHGGPDPLAHHLSSVLNAVAGLASSLHEAEYACFLALRSAKRTQNQLKTLLKPLRHHKKTNYKHEHEDET